MKCEYCVYGNVCASDKRDECICFNSSENKCMRKDLSVSAQEIMKSNVLKRYVFELKRAYKRYLKQQRNSMDDIEGLYYAGKADGVLCVLNDLGFGYLV